MSDYPIVWSPTAKLSYFKILEYLNDKWTIKELKAFVDRTEVVIAHICNNPLLYPYSKERDAHRCVVVKQVTLFYRIKSNTIELLVFWDSRQDPAKIAI